MNAKLLILVAAVALAVVAPGAAGADATATIQCSDGTTWVLDPATIDVASFGDAICDGYVVLAPDATSAVSDTEAVASIGAGDFNLSSAMSPDPTAYVTEVQCPNGQIWAVASGDDFVCPAA